MERVIRTVVQCTLMTLAGTALAASAAQLRLEPGKWRVNTVSSTKGVADPPQDEETCLRPDELKDLHKYFTPALEGVPGAKCTVTRQPAAGDAIAYRARCSGNGFTMEIRSTVTIASPERFHMLYRSATKTVREEAVVVAESQAVRLGPCERQ
jgi:hypothetical protein